MAVDILDRIIAETRRELARRKEREPLDLVKARAGAAPAPRSLRQRLRRRAEDGAFARIVAEIKKASPSKGLIRADFDPPAIARAYVAGGAAGISVLTDTPFFQGRLEDLSAVRAEVDVPLLRKDFIVDAYQVWESRAAGADAVLLIVAALEQETLAELHALAGELGMDALVEVHDRAELARAAELAPAMVGVNNRDLRTFEVRLETTRELLEERPASALFVSESGFSERAEIDRLRSWGVDAFLIGESLMRAPDPAAALRALTLAGEEETRGV